MEDPTIALALSLSRYKENFIFESMENANGVSVVFVETREEPASVGGDERFVLPSNTDLLLLCSVTTLKPSERPRTRNEMYIPKSEGLLSLFQRHIYLFFSTALTQPTTSSE